MKFLRTATRAEVLEVFHSNGHKVGMIVWDNMWGQYHFVSEGCILHDYDMKEIYKFMKRLK